MWGAGQKGRDKRIKKERLVMQKPDVGGKSGAVKTWPWERLTPLKTNPTRKCAWGGGGGGEDPEVRTGQGGPLPRGTKRNLPGEKLISSRALTGVVER